MKPWDRLLQSPVPQDIVLAISLMEAAGELIYKREISIPNNIQTFVINTDNYTIWTTYSTSGIPNRTTLRVEKVEIESRRYYWPDLSFDLRNK